LTARQGARARDNRREDEAVRLAWANDILPNLEVRTGAAAYGRPALQEVLEVE